VLEAAWASHNDFHYYAFWMGELAAILTAFYSGRLIWLTFHGAPRADEHTMHHVHESPPVMLVPLVVLAVGAVFSGWLGLGMIDSEYTFWAGAIYHGENNHVLHDMHEVPVLVKLAPLFAMAFGLALSYYVYMMRPGLGERIAGMAGPINTFFYNKWYFDELYDFLFVRPAKAIGLSLWRGGDMGIIDKYGPDGIAHTTMDTAKRVMRLQTGYVYHYAFAMLIGVAALVTWYLYLRLG
jgi:NADH-quinone oxidoreductase subunit L